MTSRGHGHGLPDPRTATRRRPRWRDRSRTGGESSRGTAFWDPGMRPSATANPTTRLGTQPMQVLRGIAISPGIAQGPVVVLDRHGLALPPRVIAEESVVGELDRLGG